MCSFRFKTYFPWVFLPFIFHLLEWTPIIYGPKLNPASLEYEHDSMLLYQLYLLNYFTLFALEYIVQVICAFFVLCIGFKLCQRIQFLNLIKFTLNAFRTSVKTKNVRREEILGIDHFDNHSELDQKIPIQKKDVNIFAEMKQMQLEQSDLLLKEMKKCQEEQREQLVKILKTHTDTKFENFEMEIKKNQKEQFSDMKNQQKLFLMQLQNNSKKNEFQDSKFTEIKDGMQQKIDNQSKIIEKQYGELKNKCSEIKTSINNQTRQQGILQNLVLDLKNSDHGSEKAQEESECPKRSKECKICMDKDLSVALRPCGHIVVCEDCVGKLSRKCPTCRETIIGTLKIYLP